MGAGPSKFEATHWEASSSSAAASSSSTVKQSWTIDGAPPIAGHVQYDFRVGAPSSTAHTSTSTTSVMMDWNMVMNACSLKKDDDEPKATTVGTNNNARSIYQTRALPPSSDDNNSSTVGFDVWMQETSSTDGRVTWRPVLRILQQKPQLSADHDKKNSDNSNAQQKDNHDRLWIIYRYDQPSFEGQRPAGSCSWATPQTKSSATVAGTEDSHGTQNKKFGVYYKVACVTVAWSQQAAVVARYSAPSVDYLAQLEAKAEAIAQMEAQERKLKALSQEQGPPPKVVATTTTTTKSNNKKPFWSSSFSGEDDNDTDEELFLAARQVAARRRQQKVVPEDDNKKYPDKSIPSSSQVSTDVSTNMDTEDEEEDAVVSVATVSVSDDEQQQEEQLQGNDDTPENNEEATTSIPERKMAAYNEAMQGIVDLESHSSSSSSSSPSLMQVQAIRSSPASTTTQDGENYGVRSTCFQSFYISKQQALRLYQWDQAEYYAQMSSKNKQENANWTLGGAYKSHLPPAMDEHLSNPMIQAIYQAEQEKTVSSSTTLQEQPLPPSKSYPPITQTSRRSSLTLNDSGNHSRSLNGNGGSLHNPLPPRCRTSGSSNRLLSSSSLHNTSGHSQTSSHVTPTQPSKTIYNPAALPTTPLVTSTPLSKRANKAPNSATSTQSNPFESSLAYIVATKKKNSADAMVESMWQGVQSALLQSPWTKGSPWMGGKNKTKAMEIEQTLAALSPVKNSTIKGRTSTASARGKTQKALEVEAMLASLPRLALEDNDDYEDADNMDSVASPTGTIITTTTTTKKKKQTEDATTKEEDDNKEEGDNDSSCSSLSSFEDVPTTSRHSKRRHNGTLTKEAAASSSSSVKPTTTTTTTTTTQPRRRAPPSHLLSRRHSVAALQTNSINRSSGKTKTKKHSSPCQGFWTVRSSRRPDHHHHHKHEQQQQQQHQGSTTSMNLHLKQGSDAALQLVLAILMYHQQEQRDRTSQQPQHPFSGLTLSLPVLHQFWK